MMTGDLDSSKDLIARLPEALDLPPETIAEAVEETRRQIHEKAENEWRARFKPHAIIITEREISTQITFALLTGAPRLLRIDFDLTQPRTSFIRQALLETRLRLQGFKGVIPFFGPAIGFVVNYSPSVAVEYDLTGTTIKILRGANRIGEGYVEIGGRWLSPEQASQLFLPNAAQAYRR